MDNLKSRKSIRFQDIDIIGFIKKETDKRGISENSFVNECVKKCMEMQKYENELSELKSLFKENAELLKTIGSNIDNSFAINKEALKYSKCTASITAELFNAKSFEYQAGHINPNSIFKGDVKDTLDKYMPTEDSIDDVVDFPF